MARCRYDGVIKFLERNGLLGVIRGHEAQDAGCVELPDLILLANAAAAMSCIVRRRQRDFRL
jgi:hypothetical protein